MTQIILFLTYLLIGPLAWVGYAFGMVMSRRKMRVVRLPPEPLEKAPPTVTILIPAKDEGERIGDCLRSALAQDYPHFNVVAINDRSSDSTGRVMDELAAADPRMRVVHIQPGELPRGWTGKNNALHSGMTVADGKWLLFVDSDVILSPQALSATLGAAVNHRYHMLSLIPRLETHTCWEEMLIPLASANMAVAYTMYLTNEDWSSVAFGNGQFILMKRLAYERIGGHVAVKGQYCEDMAMARLIKQSGLRLRMSWGTDLAAVRMYDSLEKIIRGWSRIFFAASSGSPWRSLASIGFILLCCYSVYFAGTHGIWAAAHSSREVWPILWIGAAAIHWLLMTVQLAITFSWTRNKRRYALAFPVAGVLLLYMQARAVWMCISGKVEWRGTQYAHAVAPVSASPAPLPPSETESGSFAPGPFTIVEPSGGSNANQK